jgi:hypothetical protein
LIQATDTLIRDLVDLPSRFEIGDVQYLMHTEFAQRTTLVSHQLRSAVALARPPS